MKNFFRRFALAFILFFAIFSCNHPSAKNGEESVPEPQENPLKLSLFKLDGNEQSISDEMNLGSTKKSEVTLEFKALPEGTAISTKPAIEKDGKWKLVDGKNELIITLTKEEKTREYKAFIEKANKNSLSITKITVAGSEKTGDEIFSSMSFPSVKAGVTQVEIETSEPTAQVSFQNGANQTEKTYTWYLVKGENILSIKISKGEEKAEYTVLLSSTANETTPKCFLNGVALKEIKGGFATKIENNENPILNVDFSHLNIMLTTTSTAPGKIQINGQSFEYRKKEDSNINLVTHSVMLKEGLNQIEIIAWPHVNYAKNVAGNRLRFRVKGTSQKEKIKAKLEISGNNELSEEFLAKAESSQEEPLHKVFESPAEIKVIISEYEKEFLVKEIKINNEVVEIKKDLTATKSIDVSETSSESVKIEILSSNESIAPDFNWTFKVQAGGEKPQVPDVRLYGINDFSLADETLDANFLKDVADEKNPIYNMDGKKAIVIMDVLKKDLIKEIAFKLDGNLKASKAPSVVNYRFLRADYAFEINDTEAHEIEIEAIPVDGAKYSSRFFRFKVKSSGELPVLPKNKLMLVINDFPDKSMEENVKNHLTDGTNPLYKIDGTKVRIVLITGIKDIADRIQNVRFTFGDEAPQTLPFYPQQVMTATIYLTQASCVLPNRTDSKLLKLEVIPSDSANWKPLVYSLNLQSTGNKVKMPLNFMIDRKITASGAVETLEAEKVTIDVKASEDIMKKITIGEKGKDEIECTKTQISGAWYASREISLIENGNAVTKEIVIKVTPIDSEEYSEETCVFTLTGTKKDADITVSKFKVFELDVKDVQSIEVENSVQKLKLENIEFEGVTDSNQLTKDKFKIYRDALTTEVTNNVKAEGENLNEGNNKFIFVIEGVKGKYKTFKKELTITRKFLEKEMTLASLKVKEESVLGLEANSETNPSELKKGIENLMLREVQPVFKGPNGETVLPYWKNKTISIAKKDGSNEKILSNTANVALKEYIEASPDGVFTLIIDVKKGTGYKAFHKVLYVKLKQ